MKTRKANSSMDGFGVISLALLEGVITLTATGARLPVPSLEERLLPPC